MSMLRLNFRSLLDTFPVAIVADTNFLQISIPVFRIRESEITNWLLPNITSSTTSSSRALLCCSRALLLSGSFRKSLFVRDINISIRKSANDILFKFVHIFITKLSMTFMSASVTSLGLFPKRINTSSKSKRLSIQRSHPLHFSLE